VIKPVEKISELYCLLNELFTYFLQNIKNFAQIEKNRCSSKQEIKFIYINEILSNFFEKTTNESIEKLKLCYLLYKICLISIIGHFNIWFPNNLNQNLVSNLFFNNFNNSLHTLFLILSGNEFSAMKFPEMIDFSKNKISHSINELVQDENNFFYNFIENYII